MPLYLWDFARTNGGSGSPIIFRGRIEACFGWYRICAKTGSAGRSPPIEPVYCRKTHEGTLLLPATFSRRPGTRAPPRPPAKAASSGAWGRALRGCNGHSWQILLSCGFSGADTAPVFDVCRMVSVFIIRQKPINVNPRPRRPCCGLFGKGSAQNPNFCSISNI